MAISHYATCACQKIDHQGKFESCFLGLVTGRRLSVGLIEDGRGEEQREEKEGRRDKGGGKATTQALNNHNNKKVHPHGDGMCRPDACHRTIKPSSSSSTHTLKKLLGRCGIDDTDT